MTSRLVAHIPCPNPPTNTPSHRWWSWIRLKGEAPRLSPCLDSSSSLVRSHSQHCSQFHWTLPLPVPPLPVSPVGSLFHQDTQRLPVGWMSSTSTERGRDRLCDCKKSLLQNKKKSKIRQCCQTGDLIYSMLPLERLYMISQPPAQWMLRMPIMSSIWEASSPHLCALEETPTIWSKESDMERSHFTLMSRRGGPGWKGVRSWRGRRLCGGRNLQRNVRRGWERSIYTCKSEECRRWRKKKGEDFIKAGDFLTVVAFWQHEDRSSRERGRPKKRGIQEWVRWARLQTCNL